MQGQKKKKGEKCRATKLFIPVYKKELQTIKPGANGYRNLSKNPKTMVRKLVTQAKKKVVNSASISVAIQNAPS